MQMIITKSPTSEMTKVKLAPIITERKDGFGNSTVQKMLTCLK